MKKSIMIFIFCLYSIITGTTNIYKNVPGIEKIEIKKNIDIELNRKNNIIKAIIMQESLGGIYLYSSSSWEQAVGVLQIRPIMLKHINQNILEYNAYTLNDRLDSLKSVEMFMIYQNKYNPDMNFEIATRIWNGGQNGMNKPSTLKYFFSVKKHLEKMI